MTRPDVSDREITAPVQLVDARGRLDEASVGWTRTQLHDTDRIGRGLYGWGRNKRWEYWGIVTPTHIFALTIDLRMIDTDAGTRLFARTPRVQVDVLAQILPGHEAMGIAAPASRMLAEYTVKDVDRPTTGTITVDGVIYDATGFAVLDHARSRAPYVTDWNWGAAVGEVDGRRIGINFGGSGRDGGDSSVLRRLQRQRRSVVPCEDRGLFAVVAEDGYRAGAERDGCSEPGCLPQEDGREDPQVVPVRDESDITVGHRGKHSGEHARSAGSDLLDRLAGSLAPDHTVRERRPVVAELGADVLRRAPFVPAVVPLDEQRIDFGVEPRELCRAAGALER